MTEIEQMIEKLVGHKTLRTREMETVKAIEQYVENRIEEKDKEFCIAMCQFIKDKEQYINKARIEELERIKAGDTALANKVLYDDICDRSAELKKG